LTGIASFLFRKVILHFYIESRLKETDGSLNIRTGYNYVIGDI